MDTRQPATKDKKKRGSNNENPIQNPSMETESKAQEKTLSKRRKQETDPLKMGHVLETVFGFLDANSIKAARQVNPLWRVEGAKILITKCYVKIPSEVQVGDSSTRNITVDQFKLFLSHKSKDFPVIPNITVGDADDFELWKSLEIIGPQVKSLKLKPIDGQVELLHQLFILLPNLKYLNCEIMSFYKNSSAIIKIIISAMSKREKERSSLTISSMCLSPKNEEELADTEKLADFKNVMVEELALSCYLLNAPNSEARIANVLSKLLSASQNILKTVTLGVCQRFLSLLDFPCVTALTCMNLTFLSCAPGPACKFPASFRFSKNVPNLQEINMSYPSDSSDFLQILLGNNGTAPSVKRVGHYGGFMDNEVDALFKAFPNTEELEVSVYYMSESRFRPLWTNGKNLKKLTLDIYWHPNMGNFPDLDDFFTGFDAETVSKIKETPNLDPFTLKELKNLRVNPSISNLKELEYLEIDFGCDRVETVSKRMLTVAAKYEISQLPKDPQIVIKLKNTYGFKEAFDEVSKLPNFIVKPWGNNT